MPPERGPFVCRSLATRLSMATSCSYRAQDRFVEHQFGARASGAGRAADRRAAARHPVPPGNQGARQHLPGRAVHRHGYMHQQLNGQRMHHGVAILSRVPLKDPGKHDWQDNGEARHVGVRLECGIRLENVYVPAGGDTPDRTVNPKFGQKLDFIERMTRWSEDAARADDHRRRLQRRAAGMRRLEPQGAAQRRQPHAGRGRGADPASARRTTGSTSAASSCRRRSAASPGGAIARPTGPGTTAAAGSTICGRRPSSPVISRRTRCSSRAATGSGHPTTCR